MLHAVLISANICRIPSRSKVWGSMTTMVVMPVIPEFDVSREASARESQNSQYLSVVMYLLTVMQTSRAVVITSHPCSLKEKHCLFFNTISENNFNTCLNNVGIYLIYF